MSLGVFMAVLAAAFMHAAWNALVKAKGDRLGSILALSVGLGVLALPFLPFADMPKGETWQWLMFSMAMHTGYRLFLGLAYEGGDLAQAYPLARGTAPLLTTLVAAFLLGELPGQAAIAGILLLGLGALLLTLRGTGAHNPGHARMVTFALITSVFISGYSISDGSGARSAANAWSYAAWLFVVDGVWCLVQLAALRGVSGTRSALLNWRISLGAAALSGVAYFVAMWAMTKAPIGAVAALRESSILFALGISVFMLGEPFTKRRALAAVLIVTGIAAIKLG